MLSPEQAQKVLETHRDKNALKHQLERIRSLPDASIMDRLHRLSVHFLKQDDEPTLSLREIAYGLIGYDRDGRRFAPGEAWYNGHQQKVFQTSVAALAELAPEDRLRIFETLYPRLALQVEQFWQLLPQLPFQGGYMRKAFRAPQRPDLYLDMRFSWFVQLQNMISAYDEDVCWFAEHAAYINHGYGADPLGKLFAGVINAGGKTGDQVLNILLASARGEHETGAMGRHIPRALLTADRPDGWEFVEKLLLAAQREEGLRQIILEAVDEAHPQAFRRMLRVILDHNLVRFSAVTRAVNVWFGFNWDTENVRTVNSFIERMSNLLESQQARDEALAGGNGEAVYLALWALAFDDVFIAIPAAAALLHDEIVERRFAAVHTLANFGLAESAIALMPTLRDADLRVSLRAVQGIAYQMPAGVGLFEELETLLTRLPSSRTALDPILWDWQVIIAERQAIADLLVHTLEDRSPKRLIPHLPLMSRYQKIEAAKKLAELGLNDPAVRETLFKLVGDRDGWVRENVLKLLSQQQIELGEAEYLESLMTRQSNDLRRSVLALLAKQPDKVALASADRLTASRKLPQRLAGLELLRLLHQEKRAVAACDSRIGQYQAARADLSESEKNLIESFAEGEQEKLTLDNALGLMNPAERSQPVPPRKRKVQMTSKAAVASLLSLDAFIHQHRDKAFRTTTWQGDNQEVLLGNVASYFPQTDPKTPITEDTNRLPLRDLWEQWVESRPGNLLDDDGLELVRALIQLNKFDAANSLYWLRELNAEDQTQLKLNYRPVLHMVLLWLIRLYPAPNTADFVLNCLETVWANIPQADLRGKHKQWGQYVDWRATNSSSAACLQIARVYRAMVETDWSDDHHKRLWGLLRWMDEPIAGVPRCRSQLDELLKAYSLGVANEADLYDQLLGPRESRGYYGGQWDFQELQLLSSRKLHPLLAEYPALTQAFERCRQRVLEVELRRGDMPTAATHAASALRSVPGADWFIRILQALSKDGIARDRYGDSRSASLSRLLRATFPFDSDTQETFTAQIKMANIPDRLLVEAAVYAPQWASLIESVLDWPGLNEAVWWLHAHTKDTHWFMDNDIRAAWTAEVSDRTPLSAQDLLEGAVDVTWFWRAYNTLGAARWKTVYDAAKYSSGGIGHSRAKLFADAMLGRLDYAAVVKRITDKRHQDSVRALGLLLLPDDWRENAILERYRATQEFLRTSKKFGAQRRENEKLAVQIGLENLARTAGYPDPARLQWAMETREVADLREGSISACHEDVTLTLLINEIGKPQLDITRAGKRLKAVPARFKKEPAFLALRERKNEIDKQYSRMRMSLETAMCRADSFTGKEIAELLEHPVLKPMLEQLIFVGDGLIGYPVEGGSALLRHDGSMVTITPETALRIAHPYDLFQSGDWHLWQRECFIAERIQPFKQVFRELYVLTEAERSDGAISRRYSGHQVRPNQAVALLNQRGWIARPEEGISKTFHRQNLSVHMHFLGGYFTPAEVEGLTLEGVLFTEPGRWQPMQLTDVPPVLFSEVMRDLDLVVSVAHRGGVDPESTASTVEMRSALVRETCALLKVNNVTLQGNHALIEGKLGSYSVHLGSAIVHRQPGGALCIVPVHAQHRGRIFLPFADDDPKTAEVISKVLLFARDSDIKDPSILEQLFARG